MMRSFWYEEVCKLVYCTTTLKNFTVAVTSSTWGFVFGSINDTFFP